MTQELDVYKYRIHNNGIPVLDYSKDEPLYDEVAVTPVTLDPEKEKILTELQLDAQRIMDAYGIPRDFVGESATFHHPEPPPRHIPWVDLTPEPEKTIDLKYDEDQDTYRE